MLGIVGPTTIALLLQASWPTQRWIDPQLAATLHALGAAAAVLVALLLYWEDSDDPPLCTPPSKRWIAAGLFAMGALGALASLAPTAASATPLALRAVGLLAGGALFVLVWLPSTLAQRLRGLAAPAVVTAGAAMLGVAVLLAPRAVWLAARQPSAELAIDTVGAVLFLAAAAGLVARERRTGAREDRSFAVFALLIAMQALLYAFASRWGAAWWFSHAVALTAYAVLIRATLIEHREATAALARENPLRQSRQAIEQELRESENRYRALLDCAGDAIVLAELDGTLIEVNQQAESLFGYRKAELVGMPVLELHPDGEHARVRALFAELEHTARAEYRNGLVHTRDARAVPVDIVAVRLELRGKKIVHAIVRDITERKATDEILSSSQERYRELFNSSHNGIGVSNLSGTIVDCNRAMLELLGYASLQELSALTVYDITPPEYHALDRCLVREQLLTRGFTEVYEKEYLHKDGTRVPVSLSLSLRRDALGRPLERWAVVRDLTEQKRTQRELQKSEELFRQIAESIREVFWVKTRDRLQVLYASPSTADVFGLPPETLYRDPLAFDALIDHKDLPAVQASRRSYAQGVATHLEFRIIRPDGKLRWLRRRAYPWRSSSGQELVTSIAEDVTELKHAEKQRLEDALRQRDTLVREVHHRIKNNLQGVAGLLRQFASQGPELGGPLTSAIAQVQSIAMVYGLQGQTGAREIRLCDMLEAICTAVSSLTRDQASVALTSAVVTPQFVAETEAVPLALIVNELLMNAYKHAQVREGVPPRIDVHLRTAAGAASINVRNPGALPEGFAFSAAASRGVGLDLVRSLLPARGANLVFKSLQSYVEVSLKLSPPVLVAPPEAQGRPNA